MVHVPPFTVLSPPPIPTGKSVFGSLRGQLQEDRGGSCGGSAGTVAGAPRGQLRGRGPSTPSSRRAVDPGSRHRSKKTLKPWSFGVFAANFDRAMSMLFTKPQHRIQPPQEGTDSVAPRSVDGMDEPQQSQGFPASPIDLEAVRLAMEHAPNEHAVMALVKTFLDTVATAFPVDAAPVAVLTTIFGIESVAEVAEVGAAAVVALEAEAAATGGAITDQAASRIARDMVRHVTTHARRAMPGPTRTRSAHGVRIRRAPRARRAHRRAVRLSAVVSAGDGPPPREPPTATSAPHGGRISLASGWLSRELPTEVVRLDDTLERVIEASL